jgi:hypothetical protein
MINNLLSPNEIAEILNNPIVNSNKEQLSTLDKVDFSIQLPDAIKHKLETGFGINLTQITSIPMRWIKGDTPPHIDRGENHFNNTHLLYLTDSIGNLIIDGQSYPIAAGDAHIFNEGLAHSTINTGDSERLMIGPMSETGFRVGIAYSIIYFNNETDATQSASSINDGGFPQDTTNAIGTNGYNQNNTIFYTVETVNDISSWFIAANTGGTEPSPNGGPYATGTALIETGIYYLYPYTTPTPPARPASMGSLFTNNAQVYYKPGSLSTGGGGSGVRNCRHKQRKT